MVSIHSIQSIPFRDFNLQQVRLALAGPGNEACAFPGAPSRDHRAFLSQGGNPPKKHKNLQWNKFQWDILGHVFFLNNIFSGHGLLWESCSGRNFNGIYWDMFFFFFFSEQYFFWSRAALGKLQDWWLTILVDAGVGLLSKRLRRLRGSVCKPTHSWQNLVYT